MKQLVVISNNQIVVSSKDIAEHFGKDHKNVLQSIRDILVAENSATKFLYIENPRIVRGFSKSFSVASSKSYSFRVRLDCGPSTAIKTLKEAI